MKQFLLVMLSILCAAGAALGDESHPMAQNVAQMKFMKFPGFPTCISAAVVNGDPTKGPSIIFAKSPAGCIVPWHWHTPNEHLMIVSGTARMETKDGKPSTLRAGAFAMMPSHHVHQFRCTTACTLYVYGDGAFDLHYVNKDGAEIPPEDALKAVKEKTVKP